MRVAITGSAGTGKTTVAKALAARADVAFVADGLRRRDRGWPGVGATGTN